MAVGTQPTPPTVNTDELVEAAATRSADLVVEKLRDLGIIGAMPMQQAKKEPGIPKEDWEATVRSVINGQPGRGDQYRAYRVFMLFLETHDPIKQDFIAFVQNGLKSSS